MGCYDFEGGEVWQRVYKMRFRHSARNCEPVLINGQILNVEVLDKEKGSLITKFVSGTSKTQKPIMPIGIDEKTVWTYLHGIDAQTGEILWQENVGTSIHNAPMVSTLSDGRPAVVHARGGAHSPLEKPYGLSLTSLAKGEEGKTLWSTPLDGFDPPFNNHWNAKEVYGWHNEAHIVLDTATGKELRRHPLYTAADLWAWDANERDWAFQKGLALKTGKKHPMTYQTNLVVGDWHWFLAHNKHYVGRVHTKTGKVEYLEVPAQLEAGPKESIRHWGKGLKNTPVNAAGFAIGRKGHDGTGFGHISAASPILVGKHLFFPVVSGTVYVIDSSVETLNPNALVAVNDLGPARETWTLSSFSYANERLYMHTMREVICIGK
jgi:outer membrane protein assembly factor BamB